MRELKPRVCRRLQFDDEASGAEDSSGATDNIRNILQEELQKDREAAMLRWNFDFENEVPLPGRWVWERVTPGPNPETKAAAQEDSPPEQNQPEQSPQ